MHKHYVQIHRLTPDGCSNPFHSKHKRKAGISSGLCSHPPAKTSHSSQNPQPRVPGPAAPGLLRQSSPQRKGRATPSIQPHNLKHNHVTTPFPHLPAKSVLRTGFCPVAQHRCRFRPPPVVSGWDRPAPAGGEPTSRYMRCHHPAACKSHQNQGKRNPPEEKQVFWRPTAHAVP